MLTISDTQRIAATLKQFDCNSRETQIYMHSLSVGQASVQQLAKQLNQNRVTVHGVVDQLIEKGLLFETRKGKRRLIAAEDPKILFRLWQQKEAEWELTKGSLEYVMKMLSSLQSPNGSIPTVKLYEGVEGLKKNAGRNIECTR